MNSSLLFLTFSFIIIWIILDAIFGEKYLQTFLANLFPFFKYE